MYETDRVTYPGFSDKFKDIHSNYMEEWAILDRLVPVMLFHRRGPVVEIGMGVSTFYLCKHAHDYHVPVYSCDTNEAKARANRMHPDHHVFVMPSEEFIKQYPGDDPALVLIDGNHKYETARIEFDYFYDRLITGGTILIHDTYPPTEDFLGDTASGAVYKLRQELEKRTDEMECFTWPYTSQWMGLTLILKKEKELPYWGRKG